MKHLTLLLLLVLAYPSYAQKKEMDKEHRFVIIEVENVYKGTSFESVPTNFISSGKDKTIIKLDTQTGDTWLLTFEEDNCECLDRQ